MGTKSKDKTQDHIIVPLGGMVSFAGKKIKGGNPLPNCVEWDGAFYKPEDKALPDNMPEPIKLKLVQLGAIRATVQKTYEGLGYKTKKEDGKSKGTSSE